MGHNDGYRYRIPGGERDLFRLGDKVCAEAKGGNGPGLDSKLG